MASQQYYYDLIKNQQKSQLDADIADVNAQYDASKKLATDSYNAQIKDANNAYIDLHRKNEAQRLLNQRYIERKASEMGLTDSGFNRTQQLAARLGYSTTQADYLTQQQKAVDTLALAMNQKLLELDTSRNTDINKVKSAYDESAIKYANELYEADLKAEQEAEAARIKAEQEEEKAYKAMFSDLESKMLNSNLDQETKLKLLKNADLKTVQDWEYMYSLLGVGVPVEIRNTHIIPNKKTVGETIESNLTLKKPFNSIGYSGFKK